SPMCIHFPSPANASYITVTTLLDFFPDMSIGNLQPPDNPAEFFPWLKKASEEHWETIEINRAFSDFKRVRSGYRVCPMNRTVP
ncbi:MAG: hypothetical protein M3362_19850, partial [Acidobacteriota bacterium]|nr:hypothetical protein [Acidobacteriota bacterium]